ncbi:MAG: potassium transporter TrkG [Pseudomonadota bacterium]
MRDGRATTVHERNQRGKREGPRPFSDYRITDLPLIVVLMGCFSLAMFVPAAHGAAVENWGEARVFFFSGIFSLTASVFLAVATLGYRPANRSRSQLLALVAAFTVLPLLLAVPFQEAVQTTTFLNAWFEMVSSVTTTGATLFDPERLSSTVHLWRALVGWMGGFLIWVAAIAILAPLNLGGFEVVATAPAGMPERLDRPGQIQLQRGRVARHAARLFPIYGGLTLVLWLCLVVVGEVPLVALCHAMSTLATSGISPIGGLENAGGGLPGELLIALFLVFAVTRASFSREAARAHGGSLANDPEARIATVLVLLIPALLFLRHWAGAYEVDMVADLGSALRALWGSAFSVISFLTTTGFVSAEWETARAWSGLTTPGLVLLGLAVIGGGVATTAGGVKLLRVYALYQHGQREMERLVHPSSVGGAGPVARRLRTQGAFIAWVFFMLFALALAATACLLSLLGASFDAALVLTIASLANAGPVAEAVLGTRTVFTDVGPIAKVVLAATMVLGRLETLAIIALANPEFWRR